MDVVGHDVEPPGGQELRHGRPDGTGVGETVNQNHRGPRTATYLGHRQVHTLSAYPPADHRAGIRFGRPGRHPCGCTTGERGVPVATTSAY